MRLSKVQFYWRVSQKSKVTLKNEIDANKKMCGGSRSHIEWDDQLTNTLSNIEKKLGVSFNQT